MLIEQVQRPGRVEAVDNGRAALLLNPEDMMKSCAEKGCSACKHNINPTRMHYHLKESEALAVGDTVVVAVGRINEALAAFIVFILPIITSVATYLVLTALLGWDSEAGATISLTLLALFGGLIFALLANKIIVHLSPLTLLSVEK